MELTNKKWKDFSIMEVFESIQRGKRLKKDDHIFGTTPYASSTAFNNGIDAFIGNTNNVRVFENCLTIANSGSVGSTFYQPFKVIASDHITKLENKNFNKYIYLFLANSVSRLCEKYSFNREINDQRIKKEKILLPINSEGKPDYVFMESYMKEKETELLKQYKKQVSKFESTVSLSEKEWKDFLLTELFDIFTGGDLIISRIQKGEIPIISHSILNNGIAEWTAPINGQKLFSAIDTISLADRGNFYAFTQKIDFYIGTRVKALQAKLPNPNNFILQFICAQINKQSDKFSYGNNATGGIGKLKILLPINVKSEPDFLYMENYIKALESEKITQYLEFRKQNRND
jgi:hypothetical protein